MGKAGDRANDGKDLVFLVKCYYCHVDLGPNARFAIVTRFLGVFNLFSLKKIKKMSIVLTWARLEVRVLTAETPIKL